MPSRSVHAWFRHGQAHVMPDGTVIAFPKLHFSALCANEEPTPIWMPRTCSMDFGSGANDAGSIDVHPYGGPGSNGTDIAWNEYYDKLSPVKARNYIIIEFQYVYLLNEIFFRCSARPWRGSRSSRRGTTPTTR